MNHSDIKKEEVGHLSDETAECVVGDSVDAHSFDPLVPLPLNNRENENLNNHDSANFSEVQNHLTFPFGSESMEPNDSLDMARSKSSSPQPDKADNEYNNAAIAVNKDLWRYLLKKELWAQEIEKIKEQLNVDFTESTFSVDGELELTVSGTNYSDVARAMMELKELISRCKQDVSTFEVPCHDNATHSKISRLLKSINKWPSYVSVIPDAIRATGTIEEVSACLEKLKTYGLHFKQAPERSLSKLPETQRDPTDSKDYLLPEFKPTPSTNTRIIAIPIEKHLWDFIREKRKSEISDLEEGFGVHIKSSPTNNIALVTLSVTLLSEGSTEILDIAEQALSQMLDRVANQIVVVTMMSGKAAADLPKEVLRTLEEDLQGLDVILQLIESQSPQNTGHRLLAIGPEKDLNLSREVINSTFKRILESGSSDFSDAQCAQPCHPSPTQKRNCGQVCSEERFPGRANRLGCNKRNCEEVCSEERFPGTGNRLGCSNVTNRDMTVGPKASNIGRKGEVEDLEAETKKKMVASRPETAAAREIETVASSSDTIASRPVQKSNKEGPNTSQTKHVVFVGDHLAEEHGVRKMASIDNLETLRSEAAVKEFHQSDTCTMSICSICKDSSDSTSAFSCQHTLCLSCIQQYVNPKIYCLACNVSERPTAAVTQPLGGQMLIGYDSLHRLPGFEDSSRGTITITYFFKPGLQAEDFPYPGKPYPGLLKTAFLPLCAEGVEILDLLQRAFEARLTFRIDYTKRYPDGELIWNAILHKENIFGGRKEGGYPDPEYLKCVRTDLSAKGFQ